MICCAEAWTYRLDDIDEGREDESGIGGGGMLGDRFEAAIRLTRLPADGGLTLLAKPL